MSNVVDIIYAAYVRKEKLTNCVKKSRLDNNIYYA